MEIVTKNDIEELLRQNSRSLSIPENTIITAVARDLIKKNGIALNYSDPGPKKFVRDKSFKTGKMIFPQI